MMSVHSGETVLGADGRAAGDGETASLKPVKSHSLRGMAVLEPWSWPSGWLLRGEFQKISGTKKLAGTDAEGSP